MTLFRTRLAIDIGSTVVKVADLDPQGTLTAQELFPRDHEAGITRQVTAILRGRGTAIDDDAVRVCSSANGGLRVGIVSLTPRFSGATVRNQVLLAGANPLYVRRLDDPAAADPYVDLLIVAGGIDHDDAAPFRERLARFQAETYRAGALLYAGNAALADEFRRRYPHAVVAPNPLSDSLAGRHATVFEAVRRAYLDDLVHKEGVSELSAGLRHGIRPTPEIVSRGFQRAVLHRSKIPVFAPCVLLDIGGATTDLHYTVEVVRDDSPDRPPAGTSIARYVFTDLGIVMSRDSTALQLRGHPRLYEFLTRVVPGDAGEVYRRIREGEEADENDLFSYGCLFLALDRFAKGRGPGLPVGDLGKVAQFILTGGAGRGLQEERVSRVIDLFRPADGPPAIIDLDAEYRMWVEGIASDDLSVAPADGVHA